MSFRLDRLVGGDVKLQSRLAERIPLQSEQFIQQSAACLSFSRTSQVDFARYEGSSKVRTGVCTNNFEPLLCTQEGRDLSVKSESITRTCASRLREPVALLAPDVLERRAALCIWRLALE